MPTPKNRKHNTDQAFAIRVRYLVPKQGFGKRINEIYEWLDANIGRGNYSHHSDNLPAIDATAFYFRSIKDAGRFEAKFGELRYASFEPPK